jgi:hypothetical protein
MPRVVSLPTMLALLELDDQRVVRSESQHVLQKIAQGCEAFLTTALAVGHHTF